VIAHEVGHHVQNLLGITNQGRTDAPEHEQARRQCAVGAVELQADCFAGVWPTAPTLSAAAR